jgi:hypothetical protein
LLLAGNICVLSQAMNLSDALFVNPVSILTAERPTPFEADTSTVMNMSMHLVTLRSGCIVMAKELILMPVATNETLTVPLNLNSGYLSSSDSKCQMSAPKTI